MSDEAHGAHDLTPDLDRLDAAFRTRAPLFADAVATARADLGPEWAAAFDDAIARLFPTDLDVVTAVDGYRRFAIEILRLQSQFDRSGVYEVRSSETVYREIYDNAEYMRTCYLPGLLLSHYLWAHHSHQAAFFERTFVALVARSGPTQFADVGVGTGFYSRLAAVGAPEATGVGYDVSQYSCEFARRHVEAYGAGRRFRAEVRDIEAHDPEPVPWLVSVEVLEHLEHPQAFLAALRRMLLPGGSAFIATAINAPNPDHLYLYRTPADVIDHLHSAGFRVEHSFGERATLPTHDERVVPEVAAFLVT